MCSMLPNIRDNVWHILLLCLEQNTESEWLSSYQILGDVRFVESDVSLVANSKGVYSKTRSMLGPQRTMICNSNSKLSDLNHQVLSPGAIHRPYKPNMKFT